MSKGIWNPKCSAAAPIQSGAVIEAAFADMNTSALALAPVFGNASIAISTRNETQPPCIKPPITISIIIILGSLINNATVIKSAESKVNKTYDVSVESRLRISGLQKRMISEPTKNAVNMFPAVVKSMPIS